MYKYAKTWKDLQILKEKREEEELKRTSYPCFEKDSNLADITRYGY